MGSRDFKPVKRRDKRASFAAFDIVIDEASMINNELWGCCSNGADTDVKIIFMETPHSYLSE